MSEPSRCSRCREPINGQAISIDGVLYHPACFTCHTCGIQLSDFKELEDGRRVCPDCVPRPDCKACRKPIVGGFVEIDGDKYHPECACCEICSEVLCEEYGKVRGVLRCKACMMASTPQVFKRTSRKKGSVVCVGCQQTVLAEFVIGDPEDTFHEGCFVCAECGSKLDQFAVDKSGGKKRYLCAGCFYRDDDEEEKEGLDDEESPEIEAGFSIRKKTARDSVAPATVDRSSTLMSKTNSLQVPPPASFMGKVNSFNMNSEPEASSFASIGKKSCLKRRNSNDARSVMIAAETDEQGIPQAESFYPKANKSVKFSDYDQMHEYKVKDNRSSYGSTLSSRASLEQESALVLNALEADTGCCERCTKCTIS